MKKGPTSNYGPMRVGKTVDRKMTFHAAVERGTEAVAIFWSKNVGQKVSQLILRTGFGKVYVSQPINTTTCLRVLRLLIVPSTAV